MRVSAAITAKPFPATATAVPPLSSYNCDEADDDSSCEGGASIEDVQEGMTKLVANNSTTSSMVVKRVLQNMFPQANTQKILVSCSSGGKWVCGAFPFAFTRNKRTHTHHNIDHGSESSGSAA